MSDHIEARCDDPSGFGDVIKVENAIPFNGESGPVFDIICALTPIGDLLGSLMKAMLVPVIGLPVIDGETTQWITFSAASNQPWNALIGQDGAGTIGVIPNDPGMYWTTIVPVSIMILVLATAFISVRAGTMSKVAVQKQFRRIGVGFLTCFFWLPIASLLLRFFHELTLFIAVPGDPSGEVVGLVSLFDGIVNTLTLGVGGLAIAIFAGPVIAIILLVAVIAALTVVVMRWVLVVMVTVSMPLVIAFWAVNAWPLNHFSRLASKVTSVYVGLLVSGLPSAVLIRILITLENNNAGFLGDISLNVGEIEAIFDIGEPIVGLMIMFMPVFIIKSIVATTKMAAGMVAMETATAGQQTAKSAGRKAGRGGSSNGSSKSTYTAKTDVTPVNPESVLDAVRSLPVLSRDRAAGALNAVPSASAVRTRLGVGTDGDRLDPVDVYGLALGGVQGVASRLETVDDRLASLRTEVTDAASRVEEVRAEAAATANKLDAVAADQHELRDRTDAVAGRLDDLEDRVDALTDDTPQQEDQR